MTRCREPIAPMRLGSMKRNGVHSLDVPSELCHHQAVFDVSSRA
jgi:hypothetical protein